MGFNIEVVAKVTYTVDLSDEDLEKVKTYIKEHKEELPSFRNEENICYAVEQLYYDGQISLYDKDKATESDFSTDEICWSEYEDKTADELLETE